MSLDPSFDPLDSPDSGPEGRTDGSRLVENHFRIGTPGDGNDCAKDKTLRAVRRSGDGSSIE